MQVNHPIIEISIYPSNSIETAYRLWPLRISISFNCFKFKRITPSIQFMTATPTKLLPSPLKHERTFRSADRRP